MIIENTPHAASVLKHWLTHRPDLTPIFDLDGVLLDARHRQAFKPCGALDLDHYRKNTTAHQVSKDKTLPLLSVVDWLNAQKRAYGVATARILCRHTRTRLEKANIAPLWEIGRCGNGDHRKDADLKIQQLSAMFSPDVLQTLVLIDDLPTNIAAAQKAGMIGVLVNFEGHSLTIQE
jgi:FMN phosphatase YigB (HAD superfamily)